MPITVDRKARATTLKLHEPFNWKNHPLCYHKTLALKSCLFSNEHEMPIRECPEGEKDDL